MRVYVLPPGSPNTGRPLILSAAQAALSPPVVSPLVKLVRQLVKSLTSDGIEPSTDPSGPASRQTTSLDHLTSSPLRQFQQTRKTVAPPAMLIPSWYHHRTELRQSGCRHGGIPLTPRALAYHGLSVRLRWPPAQHTPRHLTYRSGCAPSLAIWPSTHPTISRNGLDVRLRWPSGPAHTTTFLWSGLRPNALGQLGLAHAVLALAPFADIPFGGPHNSTPSRVKRYARDIRAARVNM